MSDITNWIKYDLYPTLFDRIDIALPEFNFKRFSGGWRSNLKLDLSTPKQRRGDKTVVTTKAPGYILEQGGETLSLIDYVMRRDGVEFIQAVWTLANVAGVYPIKVTLGMYDPERAQRNAERMEQYRKHKEQATLLEDCSSYFIYCLENSTGADEVRAYLSSRGYSSEDVKAMDLGYIPSQDKLFKYLLSKGYSQSLIDEVVKLNKGIGSTHRLTIPYRSGGYVKGFKFRTVGDATPKYLNSTGLDRLGGFFNLSGISGDKDIVIVEGELDSLHATVKGVDNVVATGGSSIAPEQIKDAIRRGAKSFTLCFDKEPNKEEETAKRITSAIEVILGEGVNRVYIVTLPDLGGDKTDPDRLIKESGVEAFIEAIAQALPYYEYRLQETLKKYGKIEEAQGYLTKKDEDRLLEEVVETASKIPDPTDRDRYKKLFTSLEVIKGLGITEESLSITVDRLTSTRDKEAQVKEFKKLLTEATQLQDKGETTEALELLDSKVKEVKLKDRATEFSSLLRSTTESEIRERQANKPESLNSGYTIGGEPLLLPSGAISILTAPTSHGKTTFLINLALNVAQEYPDKEMYLFSYEEDGDSILINTLNSYLNEEISSNNRRTLKSYFTTGSTEYIKTQSKDYFTSTKDKFFKELIETRRLNIHYSSYNSDTLIEAIRYLHKHAKPGAIFIDYIQLLNLPQGKYKTYSRQEEIKEICIALKDVAVETGLPIILGAQFNRTVTNHLHLHPTRIGEAGDIERIANLILGFWNNDHKAEGTEGELNEIAKSGIDRGDAIYIEILKQRGGRVGLSELLNYNGNKGTIKNSELTSKDWF
jgi:DNA primase catalytic core